MEINVSVLCGISTYCTRFPGNIPSGQESDIYPEVSSLRVSYMHLSDIYYLFIIYPIYSPKRTERMKGETRMALLLQ